MTDVIVGRSAELLLIDALAGSGTGGALIFRGDRGVGKSALLSEARRRSVARGRRVLAVTGAESECRLPYTALHQLLHPLSERMGSLHDAQWIDRESSEALAFIARRPEIAPVAMFAAARAGHMTPLETAGLDVGDLRPLPDADARALLARSGPFIPDSVRDRVLALAAGNPLALLEISAALADPKARASVVSGSELPLTPRLVRTFAGAYRQLPRATQQLLLVAALHDSDSMSDAISAARRLQHDASVESLAPAETAGLARESAGGIVFPNDIVRLAVIQQAGNAARRAAHLALSEVLHEDTDRAVWHRAAACPLPDDRVANELEAAGKRARGRGRPEEAARSLERAAQLSNRPQDRTRRLLLACHLRLRAGQPGEVRRIGSLVRKAHLAPRDDAKLAGLLASALPAGRQEETALLHLALQAEQMIRAGEADVALDLLVTAALEFSAGNYSDRLKRRLVRLCDEARALPDDARRLLVLSYVAPVESGGQVAGYLDTRGVRDIPDADWAYYAALAAGGLGTGTISCDVLSTATEMMRVQGRLRELAHLVTMRSASCIRSGRWDQAEYDAVEGARLAAATGQPAWLVMALASSLFLHAARGEMADAERLLSELEQAAVMVGAPIQLFYMQRCRAFLAASQGRHHDAYRQLRRAFLPGDPSHHRLSCIVSAGELAEAALLTGQPGEALQLIERAEAAVSSPEMPWAAPVLSHARALLADDDATEGRFAEALAADYQRWPFYLARLQLAYGAALRRRRKAAASREPLRAAVEGFRSLGANPWAERALQELRASGESIRKRPPEELQAELTPAELQIAQLAAEGLSNREIGERLFISHRTVGAHLYRIFPKLGVASRRGLRDMALRPANADGSDHLFRSASA